LTERTVNELILDAMIIRQVHLLRFGTGLSNRILRILASSDEEMARLIRDEFRFMPRGVRSQADWDRLRMLLDRVVTMRKTAWSDASTLASTELSALIGAEAEELKTTYERHLPVQYAFAAPAMLGMAAILTNRPFQGLYFVQWMGKLAFDDERRIRNVVTAGATSGASGERIAAQAVGSMRTQPTGAGSENSRSVTAVIKTAVGHVSAETRKEFTEANTLVLTDQDVFAAVLDGHTTPRCRSLNGKKFKRGIGPYPPLHMGCRSVRFAVVDGKAIKQFPLKPRYEQQWTKIFGEKNGLPDLRTEAGVPYRLREAYEKFKGKQIDDMVGPYPEPEVYSSWLRNQSKEIREDILGRDRAKLFSEGKLGLDKFVDYTGREYTLAELAARMPEVFKRAGLDPKSF
jgi:hypothetical protein